MKDHPGIATAFLVSGSVMGAVIVGLAMEKVFLKGRRL